MNEFRNTIGAFIHECINSKEYVIATLIVFSLVISFYYYYYVPNYKGTSSGSSTLESPSPTTINLNRTLEEIKKDLKNLKIYALINENNKNSMDKLTELNDFNDTIPILDIQSDTGKQISEKIGVNTDLNDVVLVSDAGYAILVGNMNPEEIVEAFKKGNEQAKLQNDSNTEKDIDIILLTQKGCGHCDRAKEFLNKNDLGKMVNIIPSDTDEGREYSRKYNVKGYPFYFSKKTGKTQPGNVFKTKDEIINYFK